jgi:hypothetical protein
VDLTELIDRGINFFQTQTLIAVIVVIILGMLFYFRPKAMLRLVGLFLAFAIVLYVFSFLGDATTVGRSQNEKYFNKAP